MKDIISFDVKLTPNQKMAQHKLYQVHQLYDEIEKLLGTQGVFKKPHLVMVLPDKLKKDENERFKPCPFCGSKDISLYEHEDFGGAFYVMCECCGANIGTALDNISCDEEEIVGLWNKRVVQE